MKKGFTLSEVLITLGIIGIVAAITIPVIHAKVQSKILETAFKKEYSVLQNAINYLVAEENVSECYTGGNGYQLIGSDCTRLYDNLVKRLNLTPVKNNLYKLYAKKDKILANGGHTINDGVSYDYFFQISKSYIMPDGSIIFLPGDYNYYNRTVIIFDVNGKKGPNKWGYDIFWMTLAQKKGSNQLILTDYYSSLVEKGGRLPRTIIRGQEKDSNYSFTY